jgi:spore maturation protein CgeB
VLRGYDLLFTSFPHYVERFRSIGVDSEYLRIAFDPRIMEQVDVRPEAPRPYDVAFVGGVNPNVHPAGVALLERLCERVDVAVWGYGADELPPDSAIRRRWRGEAWGLDMYSVLARARIVVNRHIEAAEGHANNMRLYEATGCGALLLTDAGSNLHELFEPGREVVAYRDEDEIVRLATEMLEDEERRLAIARAGQERTLREHSYALRIAEAAQKLEARL